ncbi:MAG: hypothetical protein H7Z13_18220 [Ferruginibacter sp.]|nr:hypothetical protein [Ferruginibacter sp.]
MKTGKKITLVYLMWLPCGLRYFQQFIHSYLTFPAGIEHDFVIIFKDEKIDHNSLIPYNLILEKNNILHKKLYQFTGLDIDSYFFATEQLETDYLLFINTRSGILHGDWLLKYANGFDTKIGLISATASNQSHYSSVFQNHNWIYESMRGWKYNVNKYKLFLKAIFYWGFLFKPFPNPHARTNAFMIRRDVLLSLKKPVVKNKMDAYRFESGRNSLTNQLLKRGLITLVIDRHGITYESQEWHRSNTFWKSNQENLLVSDNQTLTYDNASPEQKKLMTQSAWGMQ